MPFLIDIIPAFADNYIYLIGDTELGLAMVVDPGDADAVKRALKKRDWHLTLILNTHHHNDHIGGMEYLALTTLFGPGRRRTASRPPTMSSSSRPIAVSKCPALIAACCTALGVTAKFL